MKYVLYPNPLSLQHWHHRVSRWCADAGVPAEHLIPVTLDKPSIKDAGEDGFPEIINLGNEREDLEQLWCYRRALRWIVENVAAGEHALIILDHVQMLQPWQGFVDACASLPAYEIISFYSFYNDYVDKGSLFPEVQLCPENPEFLRGTQGIGDKAIAYTPAGARKMLALLKRYKKMPIQSVYGYGCLEIAGMLDLPMCSTADVVLPNTANTWVKPFTMSSYRNATHRRLTPLLEPLGVEFNRHQSDKQLGHFYASLYEWLFASLRLKRKRPLRILEVGVSLSSPLGSFKVWQTHEEVSQVVGIDISPLLGDVDPPNAFIQGNAYSHEMLSELLMRYPEGFDLLIDDGSHRMLDQIFFLTEYWRLCKPGGYLVVEDVKAWETYQRALEIQGVFIVDTSWNNEGMGRVREFSEMDSRLIIRKIGGSYA